MHPTKQGVNNLKAANGKAILVQESISLHALQRIVSLFIQEPPHQQEMLLEHLAIHLKPLMRHLLQIDPKILIYL